MRLVIGEAASLVDQPTPVRVVGAPPGTGATVIVTATDCAGHAFSSRSTFLARADGEIDTGRHAPVAAGYSGVDPFGVWWSMAGADGAGFTLGPDPTTADVAVARGDVVVARARISLLTMAAGVRRHGVAEERLVGTLFVPQEHPAPGVVVLGGSGGGLHWSGMTAALLASRGFAALALAYFGAAGRPQTLVDLPVEDVGAAVHWLLRRPEVTGGRVGLVGRSRGAELALQAAACLEDVAAVVGFSASGVRWGGFDPGSSRPQAAWTWRGDELPYLSADQSALEELWTRSPVALRGAFERALEDEPAVERATIAVERIGGPVLLVSGQDDQMWPSAPLSSLAFRRRRERSCSYPDVHLVFPGAGHAVGQPPGAPLHDVCSRHPVDLDTYLLGGTRAGNAGSGVEAWPLMLDFLAAHLKAPPVADRPRPHG